MQGQAVPCLGYDSAVTRQRGAVPPRPIAPGDVVAAYSEELGEWTAAQVTDLDPAWRTAGVLDLDWSGPEPHSVDDIGELVPLRLTHHSHSGGLHHCNYEWLLPRGFKVIGREELYDAIDAIVNDAEVEYGRTFANARQHLIAGVDSARDW